MENAMEMPWNAMLARDETLILKFSVTDFIVLERTQFHPLFVLNL